MAGSQQPGAPAPGAPTSSSDQRPEDPFTVRPDARPHPDEHRRRASPPAAPPPAPPPPRPVDVEAVRPLLRRVRNAGLLTSAAMLLAVIVPPLGAVLGIVGAVKAARLRDEVRAAGLRLSLTVLPMISGTLAFVVGLTATGLAVAVGDELLELNRCLQAANTRTAEANCQAAFQEALQQRL
jgi:hypothetical protein